MNRKALNHTVAKAVRVEYNPDLDRLYLVFEITDEKFKQEIRKDWLADIELEVIGRDLIQEEEEE